MKNKKIWQYSAILIFSAIILASLSFFAVGETAIASRSFYSGDTFTSANIAFQINLGSWLDRVIISSGKDFLNIQNNTCAVLNSTKFCLRDIVLDSTTRKYKANLEIYSVNAEIKIRRTISKSELLIGEEASIGVKIENKGGWSATKVLFIDEIPKEFEIRTTNGTSLKGNIIIWEGILNNATSESFSYMIRAVEKGESSFRANLSYFDGMNERAVLSELISVKTTSAVEEKIILGKEKAYIGETNNVTINLTNRYSQTITINSFEFIPDNSILVVLPGELKNSSGRYKKDNFAINPNTTASFQILFKSRLSGSAEFEISYDYTDTLGIKRSATSRKSVKSENKQINIRTSFSDGENIESESEKMIRVYVENPSNFISIKNVSIWLDTNLTYLQNEFLDTIEPATQKLISNTYYKAPFVNATESFPFKIRVSYNTEYGESYEKTLNTLVRIKPPEALEISKTYETSIEEESYAYIQISVRNGRQIDLPSVIVYETIPEGISVYGVTRKETGLRAGSTSTVYIYKIKAPKVINRTNYEINTTAEYVYSNYSYSFTRASQISVVPKILSLSIEKTIAETDIHKGRILTVNYKIRNTDNEMIKNIRIYSKVQREFDQVSPKPYLFIDKLMPNEFQSITSEERIRPKLNGSNSLKESVVVYEDSYGNVFEKNSSAISVSALESAISGPALLLNKSAAIINRSGSYYANISIRVRNIGTLGTSGIIYDSERMFYANIEQGTESIIRYAVNVSSEISRNPLLKKLFLGEAIAEYNYSDKILRTSSGAAYADIPITAEKKQENPVPEKTPSQILPQTPSPEKEPEKKKEEENKSGTAEGMIEGRRYENFLDGLINFFIKIFTFSRKRG
ncbi:MAG: hypothetical protein NTV63_05690 [Candidatus Woesearchaeota archaeon]|nr:hypothetical protein [Candidatus Woesearchaeota archaeon]